MGFVSSRIERNGSRIGDDTAQRQQSAVINRQSSGIEQRRRMIKYEIVRAERRAGHVKERDRLPVCQCDHRVAGTVLGQMVLHVIEVSEAPIADEIDLVFAGVEAVDRVMSDRLRENKEVLTTRAGQVILARPGKDRRALREDLHVVGGPGEPVAAVGVGPAHRDLERHRARIIGGRGDGEHRDTAGLDRPAAIAVVGALAQGPAGRNAGDCHRYGTHVTGRIGEAQVHGAAGNARWKDMAGDQCG